MTRLIITALVLFALPFVIFAAWRWLVRGARRRHEFTDDAPLLALLLAAVILVALGLYSLSPRQQADTSGRYVPPRVENGRLVPGHFEPREQPGRHRQGGGR